ncbi:protein of unknown function [Taphrina deformans PYCC 5710]|uniref:N-acetyltransferase domain-containing protein n=1 Tax=Taphrina deformans (strain PYCC 5710 / ATCC 11124 / CBS 356.35 / IMI 108563 / JCM 9778 / NBRC 8474) TaxID=1097556 RepID=R4XMH5_TAPDE|nr:protein of unknown function [Taphrina deformans PYCC 5710]|eukprot:CCG84510.1 protein of unknown function [Taphrina deformans PYCC 5710]
MDQLQAWYSAAPDFFKCFGVSRGNVLGYTIALPVPLSAWTALSLGKLEEQDVTGPLVCRGIRTMQSRDEGEVGVHFWHVERSLAWPSHTEIRFSTVVAEYIHSLRAQYGVRHFSALTASPAGQALFQRLNFSLAGVYDFVYWDDHKMQVQHVCADDGPKFELDDSHKIIHKCGFMVRRM